MTELRPAENADPAQWLLWPDVHWQDLVRYGPPGFDVYVRIALAHDADAVARGGEDPALRAALTTLVGHTTTPARGYAAVWEGWTGRDPAPSAPRVAIPHREMLLFAGPVDELRDAPSLAWYGSAQGRYQEPHLVWPEDQAWCVACEVDEEIEFSVGCSVDASRALARALPGAVRRVQYGESAPMYRDQRRHLLIGATEPIAALADVQGAAMDSCCRSPIMDLMEDQQAPRSVEGEAKVITLCGSTKFEAEFAEVNQRLTMEGFVVISLGMFSLPDLPDYDSTADSSDLKGRLGGVHFQKIRMADEVYIVDPGGYVGESTRREIGYAESLGKPVRYLSRERLARTGDGPQE